MTDYFYGRTYDEWEDLRNATEMILISIARREGMIDYGALNTALVKETGQRPFNYQVPSERAAIGRLLGEISRETHKRFGIMLSALVTHKGSNDEGSGFYKLAAELGKMTPKPTPDEKLEALVRLTQEVHQHYTRSKPSVSPPRP